MTLVNNDKELERLEKLGVIEKIDYSPRASLRYFYFFYEQSSIWDRS